MVLLTEELLHLSRMTCPWGGSSILTGWPARVCALGQRCKAVPSPWPLFLPSPPAVWCGGKHGPLLLLCWAFFGYLLGTVSLVLARRLSGSWASLCNQPAARQGDVGPWGRSWGAAGSAGLCGHACVCVRLGVVPPREKRGSGVGGPFQQHVNPVAQREGVPDTAASGGVGPPRCFSEPARTLWSPVSRTCPGGSLQSLPNSPVKDHLVLFMIPFCRRGD